jgi:hypothetical protein
MGLELRRTSGKQINGSTLVVPGQPILGYKKFENSFGYKKKPDIYEGYPVDQPQITPIPTSTPIPTPTSTPTPTPTSTPTPTPSPTPDQILLNPIITNNQEYISTESNFYLMFVD